MVATELRIDPTADDRARLREQASALFLRFLRQIHTEATEPWLELELTMPQLKMLLVVDWLGSAAMSQVAARLGIGLSAATGLVERLEEQGMVRREHDARDRRVVLVAPTPRGRELVCKLRSSNSERLGRVLEHLSPAALEQCVAVLAMVNRAAEEQYGLQERNGAAQGARALEDRA